MTFPGNLQVAFASRQRTILILLDSVTKRICLKLYGLEMIQKRKIRGPEDNISVIGDVVPFVEMRS